MEELALPPGALDSLRDGRVFVAGATTLLGQAIVRVATADGGILACGAGLPDDALRDAAAMIAAFRQDRPTHVVVTAGRSGGIASNRHAPADLMADNLRVITAVLTAARACRVPRLLYVASSCAYPREAPQPMQPGTLWSGPLEPTSAAYATAKLAGIVLCQAIRDQDGLPYIVGIAGDSYGPGDDFSPDDSHVVPGLIRRMHDARARGDATFAVWGTGRQVRDLVYVDDVARGCLLALARYDNRDPVNIASGLGTTMADLARVVRDVVGFAGELDFDTTRPDGTPVKLLDATVLRECGFAPRVGLRDGVAITYRWFLDYRAASPA